MNAANGLPPDGAAAPATPAPPPVQKPRRRRRRRLLALLAILAVACLLTGSCSADRLVLGTDPGAPADTGGATRRLIERDGITVECWVARSPGARGQAGSPAREPEALILYFTGKGTRAETWTAVVADGWGGRPVEVWGVNYPGFGGTTGPPRMSRVGPSALVAYDGAREAAAGKPVFVQGASFGTVPALHVAARRPVDGVILHKPPPLRQLILGQYGWWNLWLFAGPVAAGVPADLDSLANARRCSAPAVFVLHGADQVIAPKYQRRIADGYAGPKRVIDFAGARHDDPLSREVGEKNDAAIEWMLRSGGP